MTKLAGICDYWNMAGDAAGGPRQLAWGAWDKGYDHVGEAVIHQSLPVFVELRQSPRVVFHCPMGLERDAQRSMSIRGWLDAPANLRESYIRLTHRLVAAGFEVLTYTGLFQGWPAGQSPAALAHDLTLCLNILTRCAGGFIFDHAGDQEASSLWAATVRLVQATGRAVWVEGGDLRKHWARTPSAAATNMRLDLLDEWTAGQAATGAERLLLMMRSPAEDTVELARAYAARGYTPCVSIGQLGGDALVKAWRGA